MSEKTKRAQARNQANRETSAAKRTRRAVLLSRVQKLTSVERKAAHAKGQLPCGTELTELRQHGITLPLPGERRHRLI